MERESSLLPVGNQSACFHLRAHVHDLVCMYMRVRLRVRKRFLDLKLQRIHGLGATWTSLLAWELRRVNSHFWRPPKMRLGGHDASI